MNGGRGGGGGWSGADVMLCFGLADLIVGAEFPDPILLPPSIVALQPRPVEPLQILHHRDLFHLA